MKESTRYLKKKLRELESEVERLKIDEEKYRQIWEYIPDAIFLTKIGGKNSGTILNANPAAEKQTGYELKELTGMNIVTGLPDDPAAGALADEREAELIRGNPVLFMEKKKKKDGSEYWTEVHIRNIRVGEEYVALSVNRDITKWKTAEEALKKSEENFRELFEHIPDAIFLTVFGGPSHGKIFSANSAAVEQTGFSRDELTGMTIGEMLPGDRYQTGKSDEIKDLLAKNSYVRFEEIKEKKGGAKYWTEVLLRKIDRGKEQVVISINRDITERKRSEAEILRLKEGLEREVAEKTGELRQKVSDLQRFFDASVDRELRLKELYDEVEFLQAEIKKYKGNPEF